jgi:uroporphyrinogen decarboxylase
MTRRDHVLKAMNFEQAAKVPVDFGGHRSSGIMAVTYVQLREYLGLPKKPVKVFDMIQQLAVIDDDVLDLFDVDTIELGRGFNLAEEDWKPWVLPDGSDCLIPAYIDLEKVNDDWHLKNPSGTWSGVMRKGMLYFDQVHWPYLEGIPDDLVDLGRVIDDVMWSVPTPPKIGVGPASVSIDELEAGAKHLRMKTDRAIIYLFGGSFFELGQFLCRNDNFMINMAIAPEKTHRLLDGLLALYLANLDKYLPRIAPYIDIILFGDDLGMQSGPLISLAMYEEFFKPREAIVWSKVKELAPQVKIQMHSCGSIRQFLPGLIEAGLDVVNPVQTSCAGMEPQELKRDFGRTICLWGGGCDSQSVLPNKSPKEVREHVLERLRILSPGGGFVFQQIHNIMAGVPPENIVAMFEAVKEFNEC